MGEMTTETDTMQAVVQDAYGGAEQLRVATVPRPTPGPGEVLVEVVAAGLDRGVWHLMAGLPLIMRVMGFGFRRPKQPVPGMDLAGRVVAVGEGVERFALGDEVLGIGAGTFAQYAVAPESKLVHKPAGVTFEQAAAATISGITALQALTTVGRVAPGQHVLVLGASGGVGSFAVQLAKAAGAEVTGVASAAKLDAVRSIGADHVVDYASQSIDATGTRYDLIVDTGGRNRLAVLRRALTPKGTLVIVGGEGGDRLTGGIGRQLRAAMLSPFVGQRLSFFMSAESQESIAALAAHLAAGEVVTAVGPTYGLEQVPDAIRDMEAGTIIGKAVVRIAAP